MSVCKYFLINLKFFGVITGLCLFDSNAAMFVFVQELAVSERQKKQAQLERDELAEEMVNNSSGK